jgi:pseudouridine synthase
VNGKVVQTPDHWVDPEHDRVVLDGKPLRSEAKRYILLYKPKGYITSTRHTQGWPTVYDLLGDVDTFVGTVGRLDLDTSGLLLLTNDNDFAEHITNPELKIPKTYLVKASTLLSDDDLQKLRDGVELQDGPTRPAQVRRVRDSAKYSFIEMTITEGRNRQVRRMIEAVGSKVLKLVRTAIGPVSIGRLEIGKWRELTPAERKQLDAPPRKGGTSSG